MQREDVVKLRCPQCGRFLADVRDFGRVVCRDCGSELTYRSKQERVSKPSMIHIMAAS